MAKRMTSTEIWDKEWFMDLSPDLKCLVRYVFDNCDHAGVWSQNYKLASLRINSEIKFSDTDLLKIDGGDQFEKLPNGKIFIPDFINFQYGTLSEKSPAHNPVFKSIEKNNLHNRVFNRVSDTLKDKDKDKDRDEVKDEVKDSPEFILNQMLTIHLEINPDTIQSRADDLPAVRKIAEFITKGKGVEHVAPNEITDVWRLVCQGVKQTSFWSGKSLKTIAGNFQSVITDIKKLNGKPNSKNGKYSTDEALEILRQFTTS